MIEIFAKPLGALVHILYELVSVLDTHYISGYAIAIIIATLLLKSALLPLTLKQTRSMSKMQEIQPELKALQKKYKNDAQTLQQKTMELYKEKGVNPFGGCLPLLIQMPIIMGFFYVLRDPVKYIFSNQAEVFATINKTFLWIHDLGFSANFVGEGIVDGMGLPEGVINGLSLGGLDLPLIGKALPVLAIISAVTTYFQTKMTNPNSSSDGGQAQQTQKTMTLMMPFMIFFFALNFPAGLALYWVVSNTFQIGQQYFVNRNMYKLKG